MWVRFYLSINNFSSFRLWLFFALLSFFGRVAGKSIKPIAARRTQNVFHDPKSNRPNGNRDSIKRLNLFGDFVWCALDGWERCQRMLWLQCWLIRKGTEEGNVEGSMERKNGDEWNKKKLDRRLKPERLGRAGKCGLIWTCSEDPVGIRRSRWPPSASKGGHGRSLGTKIPS